MNELKGLTTDEVVRSREKYGRNVLTPPERKSLWVKFVEKFADPLIIILLVAGTLSVCISLYEYFCAGHGASVFFEPVGIFVAILLATGLSFIFEEQAEREFLVLNMVNDEEPVQVIRASGAMMVPKCDIVVGDIVLLATGQEVPADGRLVEAVTMSVDESTLTGESLCHKTTDESHFDPEATYPSNRVLRGTKVMEGHGVMVVDHVGDATENGKVYTEAQIDEGKRTPLDMQFVRLGNLISWSSYAVGFLIVMGRISVWFMTNDGFDAESFVTYILQSFMLAVTLVVCSVPEGLPMAVTLSLAYSMKRMLRTNNLVRKMHACETMGATTVICTDKTGTLTQNRMTVVDTLVVGENTQLCMNMAVNSTAMLDVEGKPVGNPTEGALLVWLKDKGFDYLSMRNEVRKISEVPFCTERKYMSTTVCRGDREVTFIKGAPEIVAEMCGTEVPEEVLVWQRQAKRTLAFASDGVLSGFVAIADPVRDEVPGAIAECHRAGIVVKVVTGDTVGTACEIARQIGLVVGKENVITGPEFAALTDDELSARANDIKVIARARPADKKRMVEALQRLGHVVAVTGDGTNDAPALNAANVGLSMGDGTAVAKQASDITIVDNSFASIGRAVMWGRSLYQNIQRFIMFQMTINVAACLVVLGGAFMDTRSPLTVTQMLWINLIMDTFAAMALASLPPNKEVMQCGPRRQSDFIISRSMWVRILGMGVGFAVFLLLVLWRMQHVESNDLFDLVNFAGLPSGGHFHLTDHECSLFFTTFVMLQFWNMFNARAFATGHSALDLRGCKGFRIIALMIFFGQILIVQVGGHFFNVTPLSFYEWFSVIAVTSLVFVAGEVYRYCKK